MTHSPARVLAKLLVDLAMGTDPTAGTDWPVYTDGEPSSPDNTITTFNKDGGQTVRFMPTGTFDGPAGVQVRVRAKDNPTGWVKTDSLATALAGVYRRSVTVGTSVYQVHCLSQMGNVLSLGKEAPTSKRNLFTVNMVMSVQQCS